MTTWNCGLLKMPAIPKIPGAAPVATPPISASIELEAMAELTEVPTPERRPEVTGSLPMTVPPDWKG